MSDPNAPEVAKQSYLPDYSAFHGTAKHVPSQVLEMPGIGRVKVHYASNIGISVMEAGEGEPLRVAVTTYMGAIGGKDGVGVFIGLPVEHARAVASGIIRACGLIEAGVDVSAFSTQPPEQPQ